MWREWLSRFERAGRIEERYLLVSGRLEDLGPALDCLALDGRVLHSPALNSLEEDVDGSGEEMQFNGGAGGTGLKAQRISLGAGPGAPFDDDGKAEVQ